MRGDANINARDRHARDATVNPREVTSRARRRRRRQPDDRRARRRKSRGAAITTSKHPIFECPGDARVVRA